MTHIHKATGMTFDISYLCDAGTGCAHDITLIAFWYTDTDDSISKMTVVDYYFGDYDASITDTYIDSWLEKHPEVVRKVTKLHNIKSFISSLRTLNNAMSSVSYKWDKVCDDDHINTAAADAYYPFEESFDDVCISMREWTGIVIDNLARVAGSLSMGLPTIEE